MHGRSRVPLSVEEDAERDAKKREALRTKVSQYKELQSDVLNNHRNKM